VQNKKNETKFQVFALPSARNLQKIKVEGKEKQSFSVCRKSPVDGFNSEMLIR
jgi:hypothetical protein